MKVPSETDIYIIFKPGIPSTSNTGRKICNTICAAILVAATVVVLIVLLVLLLLLLLLVVVVVVVVVVEEQTVLIISLKIISLLCFFYRCG